MNQSVPELLGQGLVMTVLGMGLVFAALVLLWGIMALLTRVFRDAAEETAATGDSTSKAELLAAEPVGAADESVDALTTERARVAALVAGALIANAVPLLMEVPLGPVFEHGRTAPIWVSANRARALQSWQPPRVAELLQHADRD